jgi:hypothetical protein
MSDATLIASVTRRLSIRPKFAAAVTVALKAFPADLDGNYTILAQVTDPNLATTSVSSQKVVDIAPAFISLSSTLSAATPATVAPGRFITVTFTVHNAGNTDSTGSATINLGLSTDGITQMAGGTSITRTYRVPTGKSLILRERITVPTGTPAGMYFPFVSFAQGANSTQAVRTAVTVS